MLYKPSHRPSAFWRHQLCARAAKGQNDESTEETDGAGRAGRAAPPRSTYKVYALACTSGISVPLVVFPVMPKLKLYCSCEKNSFCITYAQLLITIPAHSFPYCPIPAGCRLHLLGCFGCMLFWVATPGLCIFAEVAVYRGARSGHAQMVFHFWVGI